MKSVVGVRRDAKKKKNIQLPKTWATMLSNVLVMSWCCCTNVEETMIDDITDIGINDDTQDEELLFENMMKMPMQDDSQHVDEEEDEETEEEEEEEEEEEHATQIHTDARHTKK